MVIVLEKIMQKVSKIQLFSCNNGHLLQKLKITQKRVVIPVVTRTSLQNITTSNSPVSLQVLLMGQSFIHFCVGEI